MSKTCLPYSKTPLQINHAKAIEAIQSLTDEQFIHLYFKVIDKFRQEVPFQLNRAQLHLSKHWGEWNVILKARKLGMSVYTQAKFLSRCLRKKNRNAVVLSFDKDAGSRMLDRTRWIIDHLPFPVKLERESRNEFYVKETNSKMFIGTPGSKSFGRGDDITDLHISEYAFWEDTTIMTGLMEALTNDSFVVVESTANGPTNDFAKLYRKGCTGESKWKSHFFPWWVDDLLEMAVPFDFNMTEEEKDLCAKYKELTPLKIYWRRNKLLNMEHPELFPQEFPSNDKECFMTMGNCVFNRRSLSNYDLIVQEAEHRGFLSLVAA